MFHFMNFLIIGATEQMVISNISGHKPSDLIQSSSLAPFFQLRKLRVKGWGCSSAVEGRNLRSERDEIIGVSK